MINLYDVDPSEVSQLKLFLEKIRERKAMLGQQQKDIDTILEELDKLETESIKLLEEKRIAE